MRHSDSKLTERVYNDITSFDISNAIDSLPAFGASDGAQTEINSIQKLSFSDNNEVLNYDRKNVVFELKKEENNMAESATFEPTVSETRF